MLDIRRRMAIRIAAYPYPVARAGQRAADSLELLGWTEPTMWAVVNAAIDTPEAQEAMPIECHGLQRMRERRQRARQAKRVGWDVAS